MINYIDKNLNVKIVEVNRSVSMIVYDLHVKIVAVMDYIRLKKIPQDYA
jgi:hypothetical protein